MHRVALIVLALGLAYAPGATGTSTQVPDSLVFERGGDIYRMTIDGSETVRLTATKTLESSPAVSPDRLHIAIGRGDELWTMDLRGASQRRVVAARPRSVRYATTGSPSWAPSGRFIYFSRGAQGPGEICGWIYRIGGDGRGMRRITRGDTLDWSPAVSPDGRLIAYITSACQPSLECCFVAVVDPAGRPTRELAKLPGRFSYEDVAWSPDGSQVALEVSNLSSDPLGIFVANRDGSRLTRITPRGVYGEDPAWSADGESIAFAAWTTRRTYDLYTIRPDGTDLRQITRTAGKEHSPTWLPRS